ncbi:MAG TPA: YkvA family protein [Armatimonadota bacterium]|nr:YkvA family protein [Armatimonadota bacterium]
MAKTTFSSRDLLQMLKNLGGLAASPIGRKMLADQLAASIRKSKIAGAMLDKVQLMYDYFRDPAEAVKPKLLIGAALLYLVIPTDLIPDWFGLVGFADDFAALAYVWNQTKDVLLNYEERRRQRQA